MNKLLSGFIILSIGLMIGYLTQPFVQQQLQIAGLSNANSKGDSNEPEIDYWVAPMDDNYRKDKPGLSPIGMELLQV